MKIRCSEFSGDGIIPAKYTCNGENISPPLGIDDIPEGARSLVLIVDDPDAWGEPWIHWLVFNIPVLDHIEEASAPGIQGVNDFGQMGYGGPCPPSGTHHYVFRLYALDSAIDLPEGANRAQLEKAMHGHILAQAQTTGIYAKR